jgi:hypothetical protein
MDAIHQIFRYHPAGAVGSLLAGPQELRFAKVDAVPDGPQRPGVGQRLAEFVAPRWPLRRPAALAR